MQENLTEAREQPLDLGIVKLTGVVGELQHQLLARHHHYGQGVIGVGAVALDRHMKIMDFLRYAGIYRRIFEYKEAIE